MGMHSTPPPTKRRRAPPPAAAARGRQRWSRWLRPLGCLFAWSRRSKTQSRRAASPDKTALMGFEEFADAEPSDPYLFGSRSADSEYAVAPQEGFPYWESSALDSPAASARTFDVTDSGTKEEEDRLRLSLQSLLKSNRYRVPIEHAINDRPWSVNGEDDDDEEEEDDEEDSYHFSTSTDPPRTTFNTKISVTESASSFERRLQLPSSDRSVNTTRSSRTKNSRVSLEQFMEEERKHEVTAIAKNLGEISANDSASVNSAYLAVSYDEGDYPQLVLQPSVDGTTSRMSSTVHSGGSLGATYPHPASNRSVTSWDTSKKNASCTPRWLDENIDMVWKQIDGNQDDTTDDEDGATYDEATYDEEEGTHGESTVASLTNPNKQSSKQDWVGDDDPPLSAWSFSPESSAGKSIKSISNMIGEGVIQPMLKPICHLVDATEIPGTCSKNDDSARLPLTENGANARSSAKKAYDIHCE